MLSNLNVWLLAEVPEKKSFRWVNYIYLTFRSGKILHESIGQTRIEPDFVAHLQQMIKAEPQVKKWHLIMDCLNIHQSESLVRWVALDEGLPATTKPQKRSVWDSPVNENQDRVFE